MSNNIIIDLLLLLKHDAIINNEKFCFLFKQKSKQKP